VDDLTVILARVSSNDIASFIAKIKTISGVTKVNVESRHTKGRPTGVFEKKEAAN